MPRQPTGKPRGRPKGSGELGESLRLTVRIPLTLFERLEEYASGKGYTRGAPQLSFCVREALVAYLDNKGQTENTPLAQEENNRQTKNIPSGNTHISGQTRNVSERARDNYWQTKMIPSRKLGIYGGQKTYPRALRTIPGRQKKGRRYMIVANTCWGSFARVGMSLSQQGCRYFVSAIDTALFAIGRSFTSGKQASLACRT